MTDRNELPVSFDLSQARAGWIALTVAAGDASHRISCSDVYDPFQDLADLMLRLAHGGNGCVEVDEEGCSSMIWVDREPGSRQGRLRVFEPGPRGEVGTPRIDATVDVVQMAEAWHDAFATYAASYDASQWDQGPHPAEPYERTLAKIDLRWLAAAIKGIREQGRRECIPNRPIFVMPA